MSVANKVLQLKNDFDEVSNTAYRIGYSDGMNDGNDWYYNDGYYDGYSDGEADGYNQGLDEGKQAQHDVFWDALQRNGKNVNYSNTFAGSWVPSMFYPKYDMNVTRSDYMFSVFANNNYWSEPLDLVERLNECDVILDTTNSSNLNQMFSYAKISHIGVLNCTSANGLPSTFHSAPVLVTIDKIVLKDDGSQTFSSTFTGCTGLENIVFEGVIGNSIDFKSCPLSTASIVSIIEHLTDSKSATITLNASAKDNMKFPYTSPQTNATYNSWDELIATKSAWTISLV